MHDETITPRLQTTLKLLMAHKLFDPFCLVGGTNLSLRHGHRMSDDIDLFSDIEYGKIDFDAIDRFLHDSFCYCECPSKESNVAFGRSYYVGGSDIDCVKLDLMYTDTFIDPVENVDGIRLASEHDIVAMKMDVISRGGRRKDFWDLHYLHDFYGIEDMIRLHSQRYEWTHDRSVLMSGLRNFEVADEEPDPRCLLLKTWAEIKLDFIQWLEEMT